MDSNCFYEAMIEKFKSVAVENGIMDEKIEVTGRVLSAQEAIGSPTRADFPILKGKEKLMEAVFRGSKGQAYTDMPGSFAGTVGDIAGRKVKTNFDRAVLIATVNAVCRHLGIANGTIHCRDDEPETCADELCKHIRKHYGTPKIAQIGLQPSMLQALSTEFEVRVVDLDRDNIGTVKFGVEIEDAGTRTGEVIEWCDLVLATGSTAANGTIARFIEEKPVIFYGTTASGPAALMGLKRFCPCSK